MDASAATTVFKCYLQTTATPLPRAKKNNNKKQTKKPPTSCLAYFYACWAGPADFSLSPQHILDFSGFSSFLPKEHSRTEIKAKNEDLV